MTATCVHTIGHSTHPLGEFLELLEGNGIDTLVDVRTVPGSRHNPQFGEKELTRTLPAAGLDYRRLEALGGLRHTPAGQESVNGAWRNKSFRNYADYMQTTEFAAGIDELVGLAGSRHVAIMCAEAVPWRCHRSLIGDALLVRGLRVVDIMSRTSSTPHTLTSFAQVDGTRLWYPAQGAATG